MGLSFMAVVCVGIVGCVIYTRYVITTIIGFAIGFGVLAAVSAKGRAGLGVMLIVISLCGSVLMIAQFKRTLPEKSQVAEMSGLFALMRMNDQAEQNELAIVIPDVHDYHYLRHYCPDRLGRRLVYLCDFGEQASLQLKKMHPWSDWKIEDRKEFLHGNMAFLLYDYTKSPMLASLLAEARVVSFSNELRPVENVYPRPGYLFQITSRSYAK